MSYSVVVVANGGLMKQIRESLDVLGQVDVRLNSELDIFPCVSIFTLTSQR